jgi:hypothetical protein
MQCRHTERARTGALGSVGERQKKMNRMHLQLELNTGRTANGSEPSVKEN